MNLLDEVGALWRDQLRSYRSLPVWVQVWVAWLVLANLLACRDRTTPTGRAAARATALFLPINTAIVTAERGYSSALSFPHLVAWPPLVARCVQRARATDTPADERRLATMLALTNGVSLLFDLVDAGRWLAGERAVAGDGTG